MKKEKQWKSCSTSAVICANTDDATKLLNTTINAVLHAQVIIFESVIHKVMSPLKKQRILKCSAWILLTHIIIPGLLNGTDNNWKTSWGQASNNWFWGILLHRTWEKSPTGSKYMFYVILLFWVCHQWQLRNIVIKTNLLEVENIDLRIVNSSTLIHLSRRICFETK